MSHFELASRTFFVWAEPRERVENSSSGKINLSTRFFVAKFPLLFPRFTKKKVESLESIDEEGREGISVKGNKNGPILSEKTFCTSRRKEDDINTGVLLCITSLPKIRGASPYTQGRR